MIKELKIPACPSRGRRTTPGLPIPGLLNAFPPTPAPIHTIHAYLLPELPWQAHCGGVTVATAPRSGGGDSQSPRLAPGRRRGEGARAAPRNRPSASEGPPRRLRSGTRQPFARIKRDVERKTTKRIWTVRKGNKNTTRPLGESPQKAAGSQEFALVSADPGSFRPPD